MRVKFEGTREFLFQKIRAVGYHDFFPFPGLGSFIIQLKTVETHALIFFSHIILASAGVGSKSEVILRHSRDSSNSSNNVDQILTNFDHLPPLSGQLGTFYMDNWGHFTLLPIFCSRH